jgi:hypothetical protein
MNHYSNIMLKLCYCIILNHLTDFFSFLLREKEPQAWDISFVVVVKIEKNILAAQKVQLPISRLFDPQARQVEDPPVKGLQEHKDEVEVDREELHSNIVGMLNDLRKKIMKMDKKMRTQQNMHANQRNFQHKNPFQHAKKPKEQNITVPMTSTNFVNHSSTSHYCRACELPHNQEGCDVFARTTYIYAPEQGDESFERQDDTLNIFSEVDEFKTSQVF